jgi:hypothetical protein
MQFRFKIGFLNIFWSWTRLVNQELTILLHNALIKIIKLKKNIVLLKSTQLESFYYIKNIKHILKIL